jgi:glycosyltransferase involved in cell wall biosynthesis
MEVAGTAGHYFNPNSPASFAKQIDLLSNKSKWESCSKKSLAQAKMFDWDKSATALIETFNSLKN